ncbi:LexA family protein [Streptomyces murinus]|uniref:LexA family protein n=1 Tax=Streptomyces murinus TaxID=33900 RepID=UPI0039907771
MPSPLDGRVASRPGEATVKRFKGEGGYVRLLPHNSQRAPRRRCCDAFAICGALQCAEASTCFLHCESTNRATQNRRPDGGMTWLTQVRGSRRLTAGTVVGLGMRPRRCSWRCSGRIRRRRRCAA